MDFFEGLGGRCVVLNVVAGAAVVVRCWCARRWLSLIRAPRPKRFFVEVPWFYACHGEYPQSRLTFVRSSSLMHSTGVSTHTCG